jgi:DNA-binding LytR/AlgR family response regulator
MAIRCLIVEDEKSSQELLRTRLKELFPDIEVVRIIDNLLEAVDFLKKQRILR